MLPEIDLAFQPLGGESGDVKTVVVKRGVEDLEAVIVEKLGNFIADKTALLKASNVGLEDQSLIPAAHVEAGDIESHAGTDAGGSGRGAGSGGQAGFKFQSEAVGKGVALGFLRLHENVLLRVGAIGILDGSVDLVEDAEVVELTLSLKEVLLAEGLAGNYLNLALHNVVAGVIEPSNHYMVDEELFALMDRVSDVFAVSLAG